MSMRIFVNLRFDILKTQELVVTDSMEYHPANQHRYGNVKPMGVPSIFFGMFTGR